MGITRESLVERRIREAAERGEFDDLPGAGKPLPGLDEPYDEMWWVKNLMEREQLSLLPPALELRRDVERGLEQALRLASETGVRRAVKLLNVKICVANRTTHAGPDTNLNMLDPDEVVRAWQKGRGARGPG
ncbi:MAG TPA: DUF1992 domain-containing protein [Polyangiaceae bacterium]